MAARIIVVITCLHLLEGALSVPFGNFLDFNIQDSGFSLRGKHFNCSGMRNEFPCGDDDNSCIYSFFFCDTIIDCPNGFDEDPFFCMNAWQLQCREEESSQTKPFSLAYCNNTMCVTECDICDGHFIDCTDNSDEDPSLCDSDLRPAREGDCSEYRKSFPFP